MTEIKKILNGTKIRELRLNPLVCLPQETPLKDTLKAMREKKTGCAILIGPKGQVTGIFTDRDALRHVCLGQGKLDLKFTMDELMTEKPKLLKENQCVADAIRLMNDGGYRHIPIVDDDSNVKGLLSAKAILEFLSENFPASVYNLPPDPKQIATTPEGA